MSEHWLVAVGAGYFQVPGIKAAIKAGIRVLAIDGNPAAPGLMIADRATVADIRSPDQVLRAVDANSIEPSGAIAFVTEAGMEAAGAIRDKFGLVGPSRELSLRLTNKHLQRRIWTSAGLPCPDWFEVGAEDIASRVVSKFGGVLVFKPVDSAGGRSVSVINVEKMDWRAAYRAALGTSRKGRVLIERYFVGTEYTVETFAERGVTKVLLVSEKQKVPGTDNVVSSGLSTPAVPNATVIEIGRLAARALEALGHTDGPGHTEILRGEDGSLCLVEAAGRAGGFMIADGLVPRVCNFDLASATASQAVGIQSTEVPTPPPSFVFRWLRSFSDRGTVVSLILGQQDFAGPYGVCCEPFVSVGDEIDSYGIEKPRLGYILSVDRELVIARRNADLAERTFQVQLDERHDA